MEERNNGHSPIARESVLSRIGRYVSLVYWPEPGIGALGRGLGRIAVGEKGREVLDCDEVGRYCCGMCALSDGNNACNSVKSKVVEYLNDSHQNPPNRARHGEKKNGELTQNEVFRGSGTPTVSDYVGYQCVVESSP